MVLGNYDGGKGNIFRHIVNQMPPHETFVSAFAGGCSIALHKQPAKTNILIDKDKRVIETWLKHIVKNGDAAEVTHSTMMGFPASSIVNHADGSGWLLVCGDALDILPSLQLWPSMLVYADPPYLFDTRYQKRPLYRYEFGTESEHTKLLHMLKSLNCRVMLSGYESRLYDDMLTDWRVETFAAWDRANNRRTECLWCNFDEPMRLHDYSFLGDNFRERERIKRKAARWANRFKSLPVLERRAILEQLETMGILS